MIPSIKLSNNINIPLIGLGLWQINDKDVMTAVLKDAFDIGYTMIDTASVYSNELAIRKSLASITPPHKGNDNNNQIRDFVFIADKVWNTFRGCEKVKEACNLSLKKLNTDYIDLYLLHWPAPKKLYSNWAEINSSSWMGMEELYKEGTVRAIGVCNFTIEHLEALKKTAKIMPMINQVEYHPGINQDELIKYCKQENIILEAYCPLGNGKILENDVLRKIAHSKNKTAAQICLRWEIQKGFVVIPKTTKKERLIENSDIFDFELTENEIEMINKIPYCGGLSINPDEFVEFG